MQSVILWLSKGIRLQRCCHVNSSIQHCKLPRSKPWFAVAKHSPWLAGGSYTIVSAYNFAIFCNGRLYSHVVRFFENIIQKRLGWLPRPSTSRPNVLYGSTVVRSKRFSTHWIVSTRCPVPKIQNKTALEICTQTMKTYENICFVLKSGRPDLQHGSSRDFQKLGKTGDQAAGALHRGSAAEEILPACASASHRNAEVFKTRWASSQDMSTLSKIFNGTEDHMINQYFLDTSRTSFKLKVIRLYQQLVGCSMNATATKVKWNTLLNPPPETSRN